MKIIISAHIEVAPESRAKTLNSAAPIIEQIRNQSGCLTYTWAADCNTPGLITVFEEWADAEALDQHFAGDNFSKMQTLLGTSRLISASARKYAISAEGGVFNAEGKPSSGFEG